jgi:hypothetical protein
MEHRRSQCATSEATQKLDLRNKLKIRKAVRDIDGPEAGVERLMDQSPGPRNFALILHTEEVLLLEPRSKSSCTVTLLMHLHALSCAAE